LEAKVKFVRRYVAKDTDDRGPVLESGSESEQNALRVLFQKLFPPDVQKAILLAKHIVISPDDFLWDVPFAALITNATGAPTYLGLQKPLSYAQSLTVLLTPGPAGVVPGIGTLAVGNPVYDIGRRKALADGAQSVQRPAPAGQSTTKPNKADVKLASARRDGELGMMTSDGTAPQQLPYAEQEAKQVAALYPHAVAHTGVEPTEAWFRQNAPKAKIIHLATHGFLNAYSAQSSGVLLAVPEKTPPPGQYDNDGALQAWEVWSMKLRADLVVLSACETGRGAKVPGEGLIGLTRAFQYAGAKTIVSSQWKVNDQSTAALMTSFHKHLLAGAERDEALRLAMCDVASGKTPGWSAPYHWAAFVMVGETGKMRLP
jgi:CHAT domain-containing protein